MIFKQLTLHNFGPYFGRHEILLTPKNGENSSPITLIGGLNGSGKTTILDALRLVLYGQRAQCSTRGNLPYKEFLRQSVNSNASADQSACIELKFSYRAKGHEDEYTLIRWWSGRSKNVQETLSVMRNGERDTILDNSWDERVEDLMPLGISNLFLFDGEQVGELAEQDEPPPEVRKAIRSLLGLELVDRLSKDLDTLVTRKRKENLDSQNLSDYAEAEESLEIERNKRASLENEIVQLKSDLSSASERQRAARERFIAEGGELALARERMEQEKKHAEAKAETAAGKVRDLAAGAAPLALISDLLSDVRRQAERENDEQKLASANQLLAERDHELLKFLVSLNLPPSIVSAVGTYLESDLSKRESYLTDGERYLGLTESELKELQRLLDFTLPSEIEYAKQAISEFEGYSEEAARIDSKLSAAASKEDSEKLLASVTEAEVRITVIKKNIEIREEELASVERNILRLESKLKSLRARQGDLFAASSVAKRVIRETPRIKETLEKFQDKLSIERIAQLEKLVSTHYRKLMRKHSFVGSVKISPETYNLSICDEKGKELPKKRLSAGEKQLLAVAFLWGLAEASGRQLPLVVDTPLGRLDSAHRNNLISTYFPTASHQVLILSTDTEFIGDCVKTLRKENYINREYLLTYEEETQSSAVKEGYFC